MKKILLKIFILELIIIIGFFAFFHYYKSPNKTEINILKSVFNKYVNVNFDISNKNSTSRLEEEIELGLLNGKESIIIKNFMGFKNPDDIFNLIEKIVNRNPEIMYYTGVKYLNGVLTPMYSKNKEEIKEHQNAIRKKRDEIISEKIKPNYTDYEKIKILHDYIINNSNYDKRLFTIGEVPPESYGTYGSLVLGVGVCESYAKSMKYLLDGVGIESIIVTGESKGQNHAWNLVKIEEEYYHIDTTWNDPISENNTEILQYNFFNITDDEISITHSWDKENYPKAIGKKYNYFIYNDLIIETEEELKNKLKEKLMKREIEFTIKINNYKNKNITISDIVESIVYSNQRAIDLESYSYYIDDNSGILNMNFYYR